MSMAAKRTRAPRKEERKAEAAAPPAVNEVDVVSEAESETEVQAEPGEPAERVIPPAPEPPKEPAAPPPEERNWLTLSEVEAEAGVSRTIISQMVAKGWIPGMEPGKQGRPQEWHPHHVAKVIGQLRKRRQIAALADAELVAKADNVEPHRLETCVVAITEKGVRIIDAERSLRSLVQISKSPVVIFPV
jgi:KaiC/GvpD/RAD55 family RecA-like ATPase